MVRDSRNMHTPTFPSAAGSLRPEDLVALRRVADALAGATSPPASVLDVPTPHDCTFETFCTDRLTDARRPFGRVLSRGTYRNSRRLLRAMGYLDFDADGNVTPLRPPDWAEFRETLRKHPKGPQSFENHRRALVWWSAYYRAPVPDEVWAKRRLDDRGSVEEARRAGRMKERIRFFRPNHLQRLVAKDAPSFSHPLNRETHRTICYTSVYVGPRGGEPWHWRLRDFDEKLGRLDVWAEKQKKRRAVSPPEEYALIGRGKDEHGNPVFRDPTLARYLREVRPFLDPEGRFSSPDDPIFLFVAEHTGRVEVFESDETKQRHGWPTAEAYRQFVSRGIDRVLGKNRAGPHGFRRACATLRYRHGASVEQIATFIGDEENTIKDSYLDREWLASPGVSVLPAPRYGLAKIPRLRPDQFISHGRPPRGAAATTEDDEGATEAY